MKSFSTTILEKISVAENTVALKLSKPAEFSFTAGQYSLLSVPSLAFPDSHGAFRCMSIASAPYEDHLLFSMRYSESGFKKTVQSLSVGDEMLVGAPVGQFILIEGDTRPVVFLVGGIGITPARSILRQSNHDGDTREFFLFYSNYHVEDAPFFDEMQSFPNLSYHPILTMTDADKSSRPWSGERGFITNELVEKYISDVQLPVYYIVGTPNFAKAMESILTKYNTPKDRIKQDPFVGM